jgi:hypothetical protein
MPTLRLANQQKHNCEERDQHEQDKGVVENGSAQRANGPPLPPRKSQWSARPYTYRRCNSRRIRRSRTRAKKAPPLGAPSRQNARGREGTRRAGLGPTVLAVLLRRSGAATLGLLIFSGLNSIFDTMPHSIGIWGGEGNHHSLAATRKLASRASTRCRWPCQGMAYNWRVRPLRSAPSTKVRSGIV